MTDILDAMFRPRRMDEYLAMYASERDEEEYSTMAAPQRPQQRAQQQRAPQRPADDGWEGVDAIDLEDTGFGGGLIPPGLYAVEVDKAYWRQSKNSGKDYINIEARISRGDHEGRFVFLPFYLNSDSDDYRKGQKGFLAKLFQVCTGAKPDVLPNNDDDLAALVGTECGFKVGIEPNKDANGKDIEVNRVLRVIDVSEVPDEQDPPFETEQPAQPPARNNPRQQAQQPQQRTQSARGVQPQAVGRDARQQRAQGRTNGGGRTGFEDMPDDPIT